MKRLPTKRINDYPSYMYTLPPTSFFPTPTPIHPPTPPISVGSHARQSRKVESVKKLDATGISRPEPNGNRAMTLSLKTKPTPLKMQQLRKWAYCHTYRTVFFFLNADHSCILSLRVIQLTESLWHSKWHDTICHGRWSLPPSFYVFSANFTAQTNPPTTSSLFALCTCNEFVNKG